MTRMKRAFVAGVVITLGALLLSLLYLSHCRPLTLKSATETVHVDTGYVGNTGDSSPLHVDFPSSRHESLHGVPKTFRGGEKATNQSAEWKERETIRLAQIVQNRIRKLQNPANCSTAKKLVWQIDFRRKGSIFGRGLVSHIHLFTQALIYAYHMDRVFILRSRGLEYDPRGWEGMFLPLSDTCTQASGPHWQGKKYNQEAMNAQTILLNSKSIATLRIPLTPFSVPRDLADDLARVHGDPSAWWVGQFVTYIMRPNQNLSDALAKRMGTLQNFHHPIVGLQVRRGWDKSHPKGDHIAPKPLSLYMDNVEKIYSRLQKQGPVQKRIFIATDSPDVIKEAKAKYRDYQVVNDAASTASAVDPSHRESVDNLVSTVLDLRLLSLTDHLVCTVSSNLCRAAYELMQARPGDWSDRLTPVDQVWWMWLYPRRWRAVKPEVRSGWLPLKKGDYVELYRTDLKDGVVQGKNLRLKKYGRVVLHKIVHDDPPFNDTKA